MNIKQLDELLELNAERDVEFQDLNFAFAKNEKIAKNKWQNKIIKTVNSFANTKGGFLLFGVTNKKDKVGIQYEDTRAKQEFVNSLTETLTKLIDSYNMAISYQDNKIKYQLDFIDEANELFAVLEIFPNSSLVYIAKTLKKARFGKTGSFGNANYRNIIEGEAYLRKDHRSIKMSVVDIIMRINKNFVVKPTE